MASSTQDEAHGEALNWHVERHGVLLGSITKM